MNRINPNQYGTQIMTMQILFWGTRGSLPYAVTNDIIREKIRTALVSSLEKELKTPEDVDGFLENDLPFSVSGGYGANTSCIEIIGGTEYMLCDAGTGLRDFGNHLMKKAAAKQIAFPQTFNIFMSHLHWDHIQGFPFFTPAFIPGNTINIYGFHDGIEAAFIGQQDPPFFPVKFEYLGGTINFFKLDPDTAYDIGGFTVRGIKQNHPQDSYGIRFERNQKKAVYATDCEHKMEGIDPGFLAFIRDTDLLITDAQYSLADAWHTKEDWGHSSNLVVTEMAADANVKHLSIFHHDPLCTDADLDKLLTQTRGYLKIFNDASEMDISLAYDGLRLAIEG